MTADRIRNELGLISIAFSPCELLSEDAQNSGTDTMSVMRSNLDTISVVFDQPLSPPRSPDAGTGSDMYRFCRLWPLVTRLA
jgi:hypothetical protein